MHERGKQPLHGFNIDKNKLLLNYKSFLFETRAFAKTSLNIKPNFVQFTNNYKLNPLFLSVSLNL